MKQVTVISGKGGTGKTSLIGGFAALAQNAVIADCDVDAPNLHLLLDPKTQEKKKFIGLKEAVIDEEKCIKCKKCYETCKFHAIRENLTVDSLQCEGCGVCAYVCPVDAVTLRKRDSGVVYTGKTRFGPMVHAQLTIGEEASGKLVTMVRNTAKEVAEKTGRDLILIDGSPGIGCPVIASLTGTDLVLIVTEPTLSGIHDLERVYGVAVHFGIPAVVCINKYDINEQNTAKIEQICRGNGIDLVGKVPYDPSFTAAMIGEKTIIEYNNNATVRKMWKKIQEKLL